MKRIILLVLIMLLISINVSAFTVPTSIRVGLCYGSNARTYMELFSNEGFEAGYYDGNTLIPVWSFDAQNVVVEMMSGIIYISYGYATYEEADAIAPGGFVMRTDAGFYKAFTEPYEGFGEFYMNEGSMLVKIDGNPELLFNRTDIGLRGKNNITMIDGYSYRGGAEMRYAGGGVMTVINVVGFSDYVCGVVPYEMPTDFEPEALKVQAICARNYAVICMGRYSSYGFDVTDDTYCQVYGGIARESERVNTAVRETDGMMLMYDGQPAQTYFSSMSGGHTEASENVWATAIPYLCGVPDPYEDTENIGGGIWEIRLTPEEVSAACSGWGYNVGDVTDMYVDSYTKAGGVYKLVVVGSLGTAEFTKDDCRNLFALKSQKYTVSRPYTEIEKTETVRVGFSELERPLKYPESPIASGVKKYPRLSDAVKKNVLSGYVEKVIKEKVYSGEEIFVLSGRGFGHGLGMSQWGAQGMAQAGYNFEEILLHYFPGTYLQKD